jgi:1-acyl-sn-glycerol-3-phosphate acyltransferase
MSQARVVPLYPYKAWLPAPLYWVYRGLRSLAVAYCFFFFFAGSLVMTWLVVPLVLVWPGSRDDKMRRSLRAMRRGFQLFHFQMRKLRLYDRSTPFEVLRPNGVRTDSACVLVANHPTLCDMTSIVSLFPNVVALAGSQYARSPFFGRLIRLTGFIPAGADMLPECEQRLRLGLDVLVFPEGTRSPLGSLQPFQRGAFELAARAKVPIVLIKLTCAPPVLSKRQPFWKIADTKAVLTIEPFDIIYPSDDAPNSRKLCRATEQRYRELLAIPEITRQDAKPETHIAR